MGKQCTLRTFMSVFPHREAENTIGSAKMQVCNMIEEVVGSKFILITATNIAVVKQTSRFTSYVYRTMFRI